MWNVSVDLLISDERWWCWVYGVVVFLDFFLVFSERFDVVYFDVVEFILSEEVFFVFGEVFDDVYVGVWSVL